jgi:RNA polymerase sigma-70 factor (ECF subfamily)
MTPSLPTPTQQRQWTDRIAAGDTAVIAELFQAYHAALWRYAYGYVRTRDEAEDAVQSVFLEFWDRRDRLTFPHGLSAYLFRAVRHRAMNIVRHERTVARIHQQFDAPDLAGLAEQALAPDDAAHLALVRERLTTLLASMSERRRAVLTLRWGQGLSLPEIAATLDMSLSAVKMNVQRGVRAVQALFDT